MIGSTQPIDFKELGNKMIKQSTLEKINSWYKTPDGHGLLQAQITALTNILPKMFGYYILQLGGPNNKKILASSSINNQIVISTDTVSSDTQTIIQFEPEDLPFLPESIDVITVLHLLELAKNPKEILEEIYSSLIPGGHVIIFSFNPYSLWGIKKLFSRSKETPWDATWITPKKMRHWLHEIGFSIENYNSSYFRPANNKPNKLLPLEGIGQLFWPTLGASYMMVAQKTSAGLIPLTKTQEPVHSIEITDGLPKPITRAIQCKKT